MRTAIALAAMIATTGHAAADPQCRRVGAIGTVPTPIVDLSPGALAAVTVCIVSPDTGALSINVDGSARMRRNGKGDCGTVAGRRITISPIGGGLMVANYCIEAISLRP